MYHFDIPKTRQYDTGKIEVVARSSVGEAMASTQLNIVQRKDDYRGVLKNSPRRKCSSREFNTLTQYHHKHTNLVLLFTSQLKTNSRKTQSQFKLVYLNSLYIHTKRSKFFTIPNNKITQFTHTLINKTMHNENTDNANNSIFLYSL